jgi:SAM-dependent methyltransferase
MSDSVEAMVTAHYGDAGMLDRVQAALTRAGKHEGPLTTDDLAMLDQFHTGGRTSSRGLARLAGATPGTRVIDLGGGAGGPARTLAVEFGCEVTVVDLSPGFVEVGHFLTERTGLSDRVQFVVGSAFDIPVAGASFDLAWTQHAQMNMPDKAALFREVARVLRPGGRFAFHEILAGSGGEPAYPLPWANDASYSFLSKPDEISAGLEAEGLRRVAWNDVTADGIAWFRRSLARPVEEVPILGLQLLAGPAFRQAAENLTAAYEQGILSVVEAVWERPV